MAFPDRAPALLTYQAIICGASYRFPPRLWLPTSVSALARRPTRRCYGTYATTNSGRNALQKPPRPPLPLLGTHLPPLPSLPAGPAPTAVVFYHYPDNCPSHPFRARTRNSPSSSRTQPPVSQASPPATTAGSRPQPPATPQPLPHPCRDFNNGVCRRHACRFSHCLLQMQRAGPRGAGLPWLPLTSRGWSPPYDRARTSQSPKQRLC